jgi:sterol desaturase/sphingolipid hydroxylase (fatty acid hydroxylase superfamily)
MSFALFLDALVRFGQTVTAVLPHVIALAVAFTVIGWVATPCNPGTPWWRKPGLVTDVLFIFALPLFTGYVRICFLVVGAILFYGVAGPDLARFFDEGHGPFAALPLWGQVAVYLLLADLMMYWTHRAFHTMSLWRYHAIHHAPAHLDWTSANRFHPINIIFHSVLADAVLLLLGISPTTLVLLAPFNVGTSALVHANLNWTFGPFRYLFASPVFHRWHHTDYRRGGSKNFAPTFPFIDLLFGTFYMPKGELPDQYGVHDKHFPEDFVQQMLYPFRRWKKKPASTEPAAVPAG